MRIAAVDGRALDAPEAAATVGTRYRQLLGLKGEQIEFVALRVGERGPAGPRDLDLSRPVSSSWCSVSRSRWSLFLTVFGSATFKNGDPPRWPDPASDLDRL